MPIPNTGRTYGATTGSLKRLLAAARENVDALPDIELERIAVERALADAEDAINRQDHFGGERKRATKDLQEALIRGKDAGIQLQGAAKFKLGPRSEKLQEFLLVPLGRRPRSAKVSTEVKPEPEQEKKSGRGAP